MVCITLIRASRVSSSALRDSQMMYTKLASTTITSVPIKT
jgi:hypothetical protein